VKYCGLLNWIQAKWLGIDTKIIPVSEKLPRDPWGFWEQGRSTPTESGINDGKWWLFDISSASVSGVWVWTAEIEMVIDITTPRRRMKPFEVRSLLRNCEHSAACIRSLAKLSDIFGNRASNLTVMLFTNWLFV